MNWIKANSGFNQLEPKKRVNLNLLKLSEIGKLNPIQKKTLTGFTLIELLIVVAIIAILAAIAIPNFLAAQVRSKVSRVRAEMRTTATALESYYVDNNSYPVYDNPVDDVDHHVPLNLTTPVAYITSIQADVFFHEDSMSPEPDVKHPFHYATEDYSPDEVHDKLVAAGVDDESAKWILWSFGPDIKDDEGELLYDPTNGTVSNGDLDRYGP